MALGINCSKCGRWVGPDGFKDIYQDDSTGGTEIGYPLCKRCLDERPPTMWDLGMHRLDLNKYKLIYANPPWQYGNVIGRNRKSGSTMKYETVPVDDLCKYPVHCLSAPDAALFLWCTTPLLPDGLKVMEAWGFKYKTTVYWHKTRSLGLGNWFRGQVEVLLVGAKGDLIPFHCQRGNIIREKIRKHSQKPQKAYELLELLDLDPKIELFARERREGWDTWGDELPDTI